MSSPNEKDAQTLLRLVIDMRVDLVKLRRDMVTKSHTELTQAALKFNVARHALRELEQHLEEAISAEVKDRSK